jgi:hypothetical protein
MVGLGILGMSMIHPRSLAGQARAPAPAAGDVPPAEALAMQSGDDCDTNGEAEPCDIDCNASLVPDDLEIYMGSSRDCDADRMPDECQEIAPGDINGDGVVDAADRTSFAACHRPLAAGIPAGCESADQDGDGRVDCADWRVIRCAWTTGEAPAYGRCRTPSDITSLDD